MCEIVAVVNVRVCMCVCERAYVCPSVCMYVCLCLCERVCNIISGSSRMDFTPSHMRVKWHNIVQAIFTKFGHFYIRVVLERFSWCSHFRLAGYFGSSSPFLYSISSHAFTPSLTESNFRCKNRYHHYKHCKRVDHHQGHF